MVVGFDSFLDIAALFAPMPAATARGQAARIRLNEWRVGCWLARKPRIEWLESQQTSAELTVKWCGSVAYSTQSVEQAAHRATRGIASTCAVVLTTECPSGVRRAPQAGSLHTAAANLPRFRREQRRAIHMSAVSARAGYVGTAAVNFAGPTTSFGRRTIRALQ